MARIRLEPPLIRPYETRRLTWSKAGRTDTRKLA